MCGRPGRKPHVRLPTEGVSYNVDGVAYNEFMTATHVTVSRNGQISVPAAVRHRWGTRSVLVIDRGDYAIIRPIPDDPVTALEGAHAGPGDSTEEARAAERRAEAAAGQRRASGQR
jgi:AbrB family looped-hinge helix DNA binding protein